MKNIVLIGMMGCGKTTIAKLLSKKLGRVYLDMDEYLVNKYQQSIDDMFKMGEDYFRKNETDVCLSISKLEGYIISTGGGVVMNPKNIEYLKENGIIVFIDRPVEKIAEDVDIASRPLLKDGADKLYQLHQQRYQLYLNACDIHLINDQSAQNAVDRLIELLANSSN